MSGGTLHAPGDRACFYLGGDALHTGIYVALLRRLEEEGLAVHLVTRLRVSPNPLATWREWQRRDRLGPNTVEEVRARLAGTVHPLPLWNLAPGLSAPALDRWIRSVAPGGTVVLHTRQIVMARLGLALRRLRPGVRLICELEGDDLAEIDYRRALERRPSPLRRARWALERRYYDTEDRRILHEADAVLCVSKHLRDTLVRRYALPADRAARVHVMPTFASRREFAFDAGRRERTRRAGGWNERYLVVYSGNLRGAWQVPHRLVEAFVAIREQRPDAFFLVLTPDADRHHIEPHLQRAGLGPGECLVRGCPHGEVVDHLCAGDVGLLLRDFHPMNQAASPGKFGEYTMSGLPIVMTEGLGDFSEQMREREHACVLPRLEDAADVRQRLHRFCARDFSVAEREAFSRWAAERFALETVVPRLAELYRSV